MNTKLKLILLATAFSVSGAVQAAPIVYTGAQQVGSIAATYSITTDGNLGYLNGSDLVGYSVTLKDSLSSITIDQNNGQVVGRFLATPTALSIPFLFPGIGFQTSYRYMSGSGELGFDFDMTSAVISDAAHSGVYIQNATEANTVAFATAIPAVTAAVPEPATWGMMLLGMGAIGATLRRRKLTTRVSYAA